MVLDWLEELSGHLQACGQSPLFIISTVSYENYLAKLQTSTPAFSKARRRRARSRANDHPQSPQEQGEGLKDSLQQAEPGCFQSRDEAKCPQEDQGTQLLPPRPSDRGGQRGEIDILLLHQQTGVTLIEVKGTGYNRGLSWTTSDTELTQAIQGRVTRAVKQLDTGQDTLHYIMPDLHLPKITLVMALPFVTREQLMKAVSKMSLDLTNLRFLCKDDLSPPVSTNQTSRPRADDMDIGSPQLSTWWGKTMMCGDISEELLSVEAMKTIVGRICGLMSVVSVWTTSKIRMEVRTLHEAISESGRRLADIVLLPRQVKLLAQPSLHRLWLTGPMGSGKTLMLQLKGRQWFQEGRRVIVINVRTASRGRPHGHVLEQSIRRREVKTDSKVGSVERHDIALDDFHFENLQRDLESGGPMEKACFVVDEVLCEMPIIAKELAEHYPDNPIWCVASYPALVPSMFQTYRLDTVLRNPPSVQMLLKELDINTNHRNVYTTRSAARGLSCDGPPIIFIEHSKHKTRVRSMDCQQCGNDLADIFEQKLGLELCSATSSELTDLSARKEEQTLPNPAPHQPGHKDATNSSKVSPLSFRDVLVLLSLPLSAFKHFRGFHWEASIPEILQYLVFVGKSNFVSTLKRRGVPFRFCVDNTLKEIAFPPKDEIIFTDVLAAHSLERKVVVLVRGGLPLTTEEIRESVNRYQVVQNAADQAERSRFEQFMKIPMDEETVSTQLHVFASMLHELNDIIYPLLAFSPTPTPEEARTVFHKLFGNMLVAGAQSVIRHQDRHPELPQTLSDSEPRRGKEYRCDLSTIPCSASEDAAGLSSGAGTGEADSAFFVPCLQEDLALRHTEVQRIRQALQDLSEDDLDWEFFAASRCLSQYITIV